MLWSISPDLTDMFAVSATAAAAASFLASGSPGSNSATTVVGALPLSMGMLNWPGGLPGGLRWV